MTNSEYNKLIQFAGQYLTGTEVEPKFYELLNSIPRLNIIYCSSCRFHNDCIIEKSLPGDRDLNFCSYGKPKL